MNGANIGTKSMSPIPTFSEWCDRWRDVADLSRGILEDDPCYVPLVRALLQCVEAFRVGDAAGFQLGALRARRATQTIERVSDDRG